MARVPYNQVVAVGESVYHQGQVELLEEKQPGTVRMGLE